MAMVLWSKPTYSRRLFLWLLAYSVIMAGSFVLFQYHRERAFKVDELNTRLQLINTYILTELSRGKAPEQIDISDFHPFSDIRVNVIDSMGHPIFDNRADVLPVANHLDRAEIRLALAKGSGYTVRRHSESTGGYYFYSATRGDDGVIVRTAVPYSLSLSTLLRADYSFLWIMGLISLAMCVLGYFATRRLGQHIRRLNRFAEKVENGERISDLEPFPDDELGSISNHIVRQYVLLQQAYADRDAEHRASLREQKEKERIKKELTNNINHELKTPVASIRLCVETLLAHSNLDAARREDFLRRCLADTGRLQHLLADVSTLTRMDDGREAIVKEPLNLTEIIDEAVAARTIAANSKGMTIEVGVPAVMEVSGNRQLLDALFGNLVDNAIAYSGGTTIEISVSSADSSRIVLELADNGTGIPAEHLPRIFERFYRVDKGRSRASGGTGLGLAIVKNAVALHGGTIDVRNRTGGGLVFTFTLSRL